MRRTVFWWTAGVVLGFMILVAVVHADEEKVPLDKVPKAVLEAVKARFADAEVIGAEKETGDGKDVYEVAINHKGQKVDVSLVLEAAVIEIEKEIATKDLPAAVAKALEDKYPKATHRIVEEIIKVENKQEKLVYYEVLLVTTENKTLEVQVTAEGKIVNEEKKESGKDDE